MQSKLSSNTNSCGGHRNAARVLVYWRTRAADTFDPRMRANIDNWLRSLSATSPEWRAAIGGDAACAVAMALRLWPLRAVCPLVDMVMTILLAAAFDNAAAANVLAVVLQKAPISHRTRRMLSRSWSTHQRKLARRTTSGTLGVKFQKTPGSES
ncbi:hypothetical protein [Bradyrhizobium sp. CCBAU 45384]|uniref:hypothetical protein n=1 Tax=Bradyrhizobium sp. CCBAU 45384 TaxID=858428 RepID=UPI00230641EE|nr:hypothetical protein [Bradyrhizobium sp. CCBAU 45384]MDA9408087.1 hypothetical protein [Bradyrhizobium sp. CCBAU 45384]